MIRTIVEIEKSVIDSFSIEGGISQEFRGQVVFKSKKEVTKDILSKNITIKLGDLKKEFVLWPKRLIKTKNSGYIMDLSDPMTGLSHASQNTVYNQKKYSDILSSVTKGIDTIKGTYSVSGEKPINCCQYNEDSKSFIDRLSHQLGYSYIYDCQKGEYTCVNKLEAKDDLAKESAIKNLVDEGDVIYEQGASKLKQCFRELNKPLEQVKEHKNSVYKNNFETSQYYEHLDKNPESVLTASENFTGNTGVYKEYNGTHLVPELLKKINGEAIVWFDFWIKDETIKFTARTNSGKTPITPAAKPSRTVFTSGIVKTGQSPDFSKQIDWAQGVPVRLFFDPKTTITAYCGISVASQAGGFASALYEGTEVKVLFSDNLLSTPIIVGVGSNESYKSHMQTDETGIYITPSGSKKCEKDKTSCVLVSSKRGAVIESHDNISLQSVKKTLVKTKEDLEIESEKAIVNKAKSMKQEIKTIESESDSYKNKSKSINIEANEITLKAGSSEIKLGPAGVEIKGAQVKIEGTGTVGIKANGEVKMESMARVEISSNAMTTLKSAAIVQLDAVQLLITAKTTVSSSSITTF